MHKYNWSSTINLHTDIPRGWPPKIGFSTLESIKQHLRYFSRFAYGTSIYDPTITQNITTNIIIFLETPGNDWKRVITCPKTILSPFRWDLYLFISYIREKYFFLHFGSILEKITNIRCIGSNCNKNRYKMSRNTSN